MRMGIWRVICRINFTVPVFSICVGALMIVSSVYNAFPTPVLSAFFFYGGICLIVLTCYLIFQLGHFIAKHDG